MTKPCIHGCISTAAVLILLGASPASANGGHIHLEGTFFVLLSVLGLLVVLGVLLYFLFRAGPEDLGEEDRHDD